MARDMGGKRNAQILTAFAVFIVPMSLFGGTVIMYFAFDYHVVGVGRVLHGSFARHR